MATDLTNVSVEQVKKLANLGESSSSSTVSQASFSSVISLMEEISQLDTAQIDGTARTTDEENVWREDEVSDSFTQQQALQNAAKTYKGFVVVDRVLKDKDE